MDNVATATARNSTADGTNRRLLLLLSLSPASKVIAKQAVGKQNHRARSGLDGGGGASFRCRTCGRCFATFQALGGHRTSHSRPRVRADGLDLLLGARPGRKGAAASDVHRCNTCGMVFPTGQALGGHMRRHRAAFEVAVLETMQATTTVSGLSEEEDDDDARHVSSTLIQFI
ncbi:hypothetical protein SETIT_8G247300v2 [Setaria italica]|uniref:C2H2-type domain-containing protein n=2 Tax=Setaria italica TaxID=4555 RepID=A0A368SBJ9_SETIT|nr:zinc finger protein ZAT12 [Setaria italica]RCV39738.1 hypothetical protein SETIT_8G247300v2 [Setaria italica]